MAIRTNEAVIIPSPMQRDRPIRREAARHLFAVGQPVRLKGGFGTSPNLGEIYRITGTLPPTERSPRYRIRNSDKRYERVTTEDNLEQARLPRVDEERSRHEVPRQRNRQQA